MIINKKLEFKTAGENDFKDITDDIIDLVKKSGIKIGRITIQDTHTSAAILVNENEDGLINDFKQLLNRIAPKDIYYYEHDDFRKRTQNMCPGECKNGHAHCKAILLPVSATIIIDGGELQLGQWQRIFFVELDRARDRKVLIQIEGEE
jgi:secondary thiamine-phosphate synthase enzyme